MPPLSQEEFQAKLATWNALPVKSFYYERPSEVIADAADHIRWMLDSGYSWEEITAQLKETFGIHLSPKTVENYWYRGRKRKRQKSNRRRFRSRSRVIPPRSSNVESLSESSSPGSIMEQPAVPLPQSSPEPTASPQPVVTRSPIATQSSNPAAPIDAARSPDAATSTGSPPAVAMAWTETELAAELVIPTPGDAAAEARFRQALDQLMSLDPKRWQKLFSDAMNAGVNVTGTIVVPAATRNAMYNHY